MASIPTTRFARLFDMLNGRAIPSSRSLYHCSHIDELCLVFSESNSTRKIMLPTDVVLEWIAAYEFGIIDISMTSRDMRDKVKDHSEWAPYQHGFETHLSAIVNAWAKSKNN